MKTQINHTQKNSAANYIFFGITLSIFLLSIFFSLVQRNSDLYTNANVSSILSHRTIRPIAPAVTEVAPIDLKQFLTEAIEEPMVIDSWMTETSWTTATTAFDYINADYAEEAIAIEDWMVSTESWINFETTEFVEAAIPLENWMLNAEGWELINTANYFNESSVTESDIPLENWMLSIDNWNLPQAEQYTETDIPIEAWMLSTTSWSIIESMNAEYSEDDIALEPWMLSIDGWDLSNNTLAKK